MNPLELDYDLLSLLPPWYREVLDYQQICQTEEQQFEALAGEITAVAQNFFFQTMDLGAVQQWEQILKITANPMTETLAFRQERLINRISTKPPFTLQFLYQKLDELIGPGQWNVRMDYPNYTLYIESYAQNQSYATEVAITVNKIKPAHIVYINKPYITSSLELNETVSQIERKYNYILGSWEIGTLPFATDTTIGVIKMATEPSIQQALLEDVATFTASDISSARINGNIEIPAITKNVAGSTCEVTYTVLPSQTDIITEVALMRVDGAVLTKSAVYVPVSQPVLFLHKIPVTEGVVNVNG